MTGGVKMQTYLQKDRRKKSKKKIVVILDITTKTPYNALCQLKLKQNFFRLIMFL